MSTHTVWGCYIPATGKFEFADTMEGCDEAMITGCRVYAWESGKTYADGDSVIYGNKVYESLQNGNIGKMPDSEPAWWSDTGFTGSGIVKITHDYEGCETQYYACYDPATGKFEFEAEDECCEDIYVDRCTDCFEANRTPRFASVTISAVQNCPDQCDGTIANGTWILENKEGICHCCWTRGSSTIKPYILLRIEDWEEAEWTAKIFCQCKKSSFSNGNIFEGRGGGDPCPLSGTCSPNECYCDPDPYHPWHAGWDGSASFYFLT